LDRLNLLVPFVMDCLWEQELEWAVMSFFVVSSWDLFGLVVLLDSKWEKEIPVTLWLVVSFVNSTIIVVNLMGFWDHEIMNFLFEFLDWLNEIGPSHCEFIHMGVGNRLVKILHLVEEVSLLNVSSSDRFVPFVVKSVHVGRDFSNVGHESMDFRHLFQIRVA